jgi:DNA-binding MarR family transcriptional regulator
LVGTDRKRSRVAGTLLVAERDAHVSLFGGAYNLGMGHRSHRLTSFAKSSKVERTELFVKVHPASITAADLLRGDNGLQPRDVAVLFALVMEMDPGTGRINLTISALARKCGLRQPNTSTSVSRLKKLGLILARRDRDSAGHFFLVNPEFASVGTAEKKRKLDKEWETEWFQSLKEDYSESMSAARDRMEALYFDSLSKLAPDREEVEKEADEANADWLKNNPRLRVGRPRTRSLLPAELDERVSDYVAAKIAAT